MNEALFLKSTHTKSLWIIFTQLNFIHYYYLVNVGYLQWHIMIEASVTCINTYYARSRARRHTCTRSDLADWTRSGTVPVDRSHHRANRNGSGTVPLRSHREVVGSFRNDWTQWNRSEHGLERSRNRSGFKHVVWTRPKGVAYLSQLFLFCGPLSSKGASGWFSESNLQFP